MHLLWQEFKLNLKTMLIWALCVGFICLGCLIMYDSLGDSMNEMSDMYSNLGSFSQALGMNKVNIGTLEGYYAIEIAIILSLGSAMFTAMLGVGIVAKEEEGHTSEFLNTLPLGRYRIIAEKYGAFVLILFVFHLICIVCILSGFQWMGEMPSMKKFVTYHLLTFFMCLEIGTICFFLSSVSKKKMTGAAIALAVIFYTMDLLCRVIPSLKNAKYITPFYYSNASDIFSGETAETTPYLIGLGITLITLFASFVIYQKRDLSA